MLTGCEAQPAAVQYDCRPFSAVLSVQTVDGTTYTGNWVLEEDGVSWTITDPDTLNGCTLSIEKSETTVSLDGMEATLPPEASPFLAEVEQALRDADGQTVSGEHTLVLDAEGYPLSLMLSPGGERCSFSSVVPLEDESNA